MRSQSIKQIIKNNETLFWYSAGDKSQSVSDELLVETMLNYADLKTIKELFVAMGVQKVAKIFYGLDERKKLNIYPEIYNFFDLYFQKCITRY